MARLRVALGAPKLIQTVVKRGYRLALDPASDSGKYGAGHGPDAEEALQQAPEATDRRAAGDGRPRAD